MTTATSAPPPPLRSKSPPAAAVVVVTGISAAVYILRTSKQHSNTTTRHTKPTERIQRIEKKDLLTNRTHSWGKRVYIFKLQLECTILCLIYNIHIY